MTAPDPLLKASKIAACTSVGSKMVTPSYRPIAPVKRGLPAGAGATFRPAADSKPGANPIASTPVPIDFRNCRLFNLTVPTAISFKTTVLACLRKNRACQVPKFERSRMAACVRLRLFGPFSDRTFRHWSAYLNRPRYNN